MDRVILRATSAIVVFVSIAPLASAHCPGSIFRWKGIGWSDGYHAPACPPPPPVAYQGSPSLTRRVSVSDEPMVMPGPAALPTPAGAGTPWWKIPATPEIQTTETVPATPTVSASDVPVAAPGRSLFRQPGE
jgi:hypothetical protein